MINAILKGYKWSGISDVLHNLFPSAKLGITFELISMSALIATFSNWLGLGHQTVIAIGIALIAELSSGLYTSLVIRKERLESGKLGRFFFKVGLLIVVLFITYSWKRDFLAEGETIKVEFFSLVHTTIIILSFSEILISVLENYAEIQGKPKDYYSSYIIEKLNNILKK
jgi:hypothetical protein